jgi:hypothetical protein
MSSSFAVVRASAGKLLKVIGIDDSEMALTTVL